MTQPKCEDKVGQFEKQKGQTSSCKMCNIYIAFVMQFMRVNEHVESYDKGFSVILLYKSADRNTRAACQFALSVVARTLHKVNYVFYNQTRYRIRTVAFHSRLYEIISSLNFKFSITRRSFGSMHEIYRHARKGFVS